MLLKFYKFLFFILITEFVFSFSIFCQEDQKGKYLKISVSDTDPKINEIVKIKAECTAPYDLENAIISFYIYPEGGDENDLFTGTELISGNKIWQGSIKSGVTVLKEMVIRFNQRKVFCVYISFRFNIEHKGLNKLVKIYSGGAFEEDNRVRKYRVFIERFKYEICLPGSVPFIPDTSIIQDPEHEEFLKRFNLAKVSKSKSEVRLNDKENIRKNDSLLIELKKEYELLIEQYYKK